jgi:hypothetical protein
MEHLAATAHSIPQTQLADHCTEIIPILEGPAAKQLFEFTQCTHASPTRHSVHLQVAMQYNCLPPKRSYELL